MEYKNYLEQQLNTNVDLLEIAKDYCEFNLDKSLKTSTLLSLIEIILTNQKTVIKELDKFVISC